MLKHFLQYILFCGTMFAAGAPAVGGGNAAPAAAPPSGSGDGAPSSGNGTPPPGVQPTGGHPADGGAGLPQLREAYETIKKEYEPWQKLGVKPEQVTQYSGVYQKLHGEVASIGRELGYPDEEIAEAMAEDPVRTLDFLRNEAHRLQQGGAERQDGQDLNELVQQHIEQAIGPIQQRENQRITNEANSLFERTVHGLAVESFKAEGIDVGQIPQDEMFMLSSAVSEILKYDEDALRALKYEGKTAAVQKAFTEARTLLDKYYLARVGRDKARVQPVRPGQPVQQATGKRPTLEEIIDNPGVIDEAQGRRGTDGRYR